MAQPGSGSGTESRSLARGAKVLVAYANDPGLWHARLILAQVAGNSYVIMTPEADVYCEDVEAGNPELVGVRICPSAALLPVGVGANAVHDFGRGVIPEGARLETLYNEADKIAALERGDRPVQIPVTQRRATGKQPPGGAAVLPVSQEPPVLPNTSVGVEGAVKSPSQREVGSWRVLVSVVGALRGSMYTLLGGETLGETYGLGRSVGGIEVPLIYVLDVAAASYESSLTDSAETDARVLPVKWKGIERDRDFCEAVDLFEKVDFKWEPISGPNTVGFCCRFLKKRRGAILHHNTWKAATRLNVRDFGVGEHESIMRAVDTGVCVDQLDLVNVRSFEHLFRRAQFIEYYHRERLRIETSGPAGSKETVDFEEQAVFLGLQHDNGGLMIDPALLGHVAKELATISSVDKESRKAREERGLRRKQ